MVAGPREPTALYVPALGLRKWAGRAREESKTKRTPALDHPIIDLMRLSAWNVACDSRLWLATVIRRFRTFNLRRGCKFADLGNEADRWGHRYRLSNTYTVRCSDLSLAVRCFSMYQARKMHERVICAVAGRLISVPRLSIFLFCLSICVCRVDWYNMFIALSVLSEEEILLGNSNKF